MNKLAKVEVLITRGTVVSPICDAHRTATRMEEAGDEAVITLTRHTLFYFHTEDYDFGDGNGAVLPEFGDIITDQSTGYEFSVSSGLDQMKMSNDVPPHVFVTGTDKRMGVMAVRIS